MSEAGTSLLTLPETDKQTHVFIALKASQGMGSGPDSQGAQHAVDDDVGH